ncbi:MAG: hypothetical protein ASARMPREDX12_006344 [Alectoria sarmentosa]|nr:MAG: hypothetical protein ASARMPRED_003109 [Alectoria sarmentosa]CAD6592667.1 MAG: hypothetical protein ASARMPREDX12_006344 [Alectoria sarmentosa]
MSVLAFLWWRKYRKKQVAAISTGKDDNTADNSQLYMQQKAELEDEDRRKHELDAQEKIFEMDGDMIHEMPVASRGQRLGQTQELRGEEFSKELPSS